MMLKSKLGHPSIDAFIPSRVRSQGFCVSEMSQSSVWAESTQARASRAPALVLQPLYPMPPAWATTTTTSTPLPTRVCLRSGTGGSVRRAGSHRGPLGSRNLGGAFYTHRGWSRASAPLIVRHPKVTAGLAVAQAMNLSPGLPSHHSLLEGWDRKEGGRAQPLKE